MVRQILFLTTLTLGLSCNSGIQETKVELNLIGSDKKEIKARENIRFDFSVRRINTFQETIEIKASLFNDDVDTVYFLSSSCDGEQYSLRYDTAKFVLTPFLNCNVNYPSLMKIAPQRQHHFQAHFRCSSKETKIKLGFDFYSVDKSFDVTEISLVNIHGRQEKEQTIVLAGEKTIK